VIGHDEARRRRGDTHAKVPGAKLLRARHGHGADAKARQESEHPLGTVANQREDDIPPAHAVGGQGARDPRRALRHLPERQLLARAVTGEGHEGGPAGRKGSTTSRVKFNACERTRTALRAAQLAAAVGG
jgi:hypothetical protein